MPRVPSLLLCVLSLAAAACAGARPARAVVTSAAPMPDHLAVAPPCGVEGDLGRRMWFALARGAAARGYELTRDPAAAQLLVEHEQRRARADALALDAEIAVDRAAIHDALAQEFGVQAVLHAEVVRRVARFEDGVARWDGAEEPILGPARDVHTRVDGYVGTAEAWSVRVWVEDAFGDVLAEAFGGLTLAERLIAGRWERCAACPPLAEPERLLAAAERAVGTLPRPQ